jgi:hypothetical protein
MKFFWARVYIDANKKEFSPSFWIVTKLEDCTYKYWIYEPEPTMHSSNIGESIEESYMKNWFVTIRKNGKPVYLKSQTEEDVLNLIESKKYTGEIIENMLRGIVCTNS